MEHVGHFNDLSPLIRQKIKALYPFPNEEEKNFFLQFYALVEMETIAQILTEVMNIQESIKLNDGSFEEMLEGLIYYMQLQQRERLKIIEGKSVREDFEQFKQEIGKWD